MEGTRGRAGTVEKKRRWPLRGRWLIRAALGLSIAANLALAVKIVIFDPNQVLRPVCFEEPPGYLRSLEGRPTADFRRAMLHTWSMVGWRVDPDGTVYVSRWGLWRHRDIIWNWTRQIAEAVYRKKTGKAEVPEKIQTGFCDFIGPRVLEQSGKPK